MKYLGLHLNRRLTRTTYNEMKTNELNLRFKSMYWLTGRQFTLSVENTLLVYKIILEPVWINGIKLWGTVSNSNIGILQRLRTIVKAPWFNGTHIATVK